MAALRLAPVPAALVLFACAAAGLLMRELGSLAVLTAALLAVCLRAPPGRRRLYLVGVAVSALGVLILSPFLHVTGSHALWTGPAVPVLGVLDVTSEELSLAALNALRLAAVGLAFAAYALLVDHDALVSAAGFARRSALAVALATRLVPTLERDAAGLAEAVRGRGVEVRGARGHARLLSPLVAGSLERALTLAEAMEARGYGRPGATRGGFLANRCDRSSHELARLLLGAAAERTSQGCSWRARVVGAHTIARPGPESWSIDGRKRWVSGGRFVSASQHVARNHGDIITSCRGSRLPATTLCA